MQSPDAGRPSPGIIYDSDFGNSIDSLLALAVLYALDGKGEGRIISVSVSKGNLKSAAVCDSFMRYYASGGTGIAPMFSRTLPVGFADDGKSPKDTPMLNAVLAKKTADGKPAFPNSVENVNDTAECSALIRNALTAQYDQNGIVILNGPATNLAKTLALAGAKEVIERKARLLVIAGGQFPSGAPEYNFATDIPSAKKVLTEWPTPIVFAGKELALSYPGSALETDFAWTQSHPFVEAYKANKPMPYEAPAWEAASVLFALRPKEEYFKLSQPGTVRLREDGGTEFVAAANGKHRYLIVDPAKKDAAIKAITELASTKPAAPRRPRFVQQEEKKPDPAKPAGDKPAGEKPPSDTAKPVTPK